MLVSDGNRADSVLFNYLPFNLIFLECVCEGRTRVFLLKFECKPCILSLFKDSCPVSF